ncbi:MAG: hypothetical protein K9G64_06430 [Bacteroidia bacterium]|nr:hypothetical protein [Bacteroidia bacterium]
MKLSYLLIASLLIITFATCKHEPTYKITGNNNPIDTNTNPANDSICFNTQILPLIKASCAQTGCHDAITREEGIVLDSYNGIKDLGTADLMKYINLSYGKVMPPLPQPRLDAASKALLNKWIAEGAKNRICTPTVCDTVNVKYSTHIAPIMNIYCKGCHNTTNTGGAVNLDNYTSTKASATTGKMICTITANGCAIMPKGGPSLSKCDIRKIQIWAATGCPQ